MVGEVGVMTVVVTSFRVTRFPYRVAGEADPDDEFGSNPMKLEGRVDVLSHGVEQVGIHVVSRAVVGTVSVERVERRRVEHGQAFRCVD